MDPEIQKLLDESLASLRLGNKEEARQKLMQAIKADERNELAWLYLSEAVDSDDDRQICLENVLAINPANERAQIGLEALQEKIEREESEEDGLICPACGTSNPPGSQRCLSCYANLDEAIPIPPPVPAEAPPAEEVVSEPSPPAVRHKSFMEMLDTWAEIFTLPKKARLDEEHAYARWGLTVPGILIASGIANFIISLGWFGSIPTPLQELLSESNSFLPGVTFTPGLGTILPCACGMTFVGAVAGLFNFFLSSVLFSVGARLLGGKGSFVVQSYLLSLVYGPFSLVSGIVAPLGLLSTISPALSLVPALISIPISIMTLIMLVRALKSAHGYGTGAALGTMFLPGIFLACIAGLLVMLFAVGGELPAGIPTL